jgi:hypothetical protein
VGARIDAFLDQGFDREPAVRSQVGVVGDRDADGDPRREVDLAPAGVERCAARPEALLHDAHLKRSVQADDPVQGPALQPRERPVEAFPAARVVELG